MTTGDPEDPLAPGKHTITIDGVRQAYQVAGQGPICFVHPGGPGIHVEYLRIPRLEQFLTLVYLEPVGTGDSDLLADGDYAVSRYVYFANQLVARLGLDTVLFLGHSHGGFVGLQFALEHPESLAGLIAYDTAPTSGPDLNTETARNVELFAERWVGHPGLADVLAAWQEPAATDLESAITRLRRLLPLYFRDFWSEEQELQPWLATVDRSYDPARKPDRWDVRGSLDTIGTPTLIIVGAYDFICGTRWAHEMADAIPNSKLVVFADSGHFGHIEEPATFTESIRDFLASLR
ncbi:MAG TPA: alpha/beta hydrolase [Pseudonocardiaceae bacterium]|nr:alpha/beta hydrolase [Pseudonocardiaceae bacterium]